MTPGQRLRSEVAGCAARLRSLLDDPGAAQSARLADILRRNAGCEYGRRHGFDGIATPAQYRARVPCVEYEEIAPAIERMAAGELGVLCTAPVVAFEETGGTRAGPKLVPYTTAGLDAFRSGLLPWLDDIAETWPRAHAGRAYWAISPACRVPRVTAGGIPVGLPGDAAYFGETLAPVILAMLAVPAAVGAVHDVDLWRDLTLLHLVACEDLALLSVWSPTFLTGLLDALRGDGPRLARALRTGTLPGAPASVPLPAADPGRAARLLEVLADDPPRWTHLWPALALVSCWDQATARPHAERLRQLFPGVPVQGKGLLATEAMVTLPLAGASHPVLALDCGHVEFVDAAGRAHGADEVEAGATYALLLTTDSGLYRYAIGDRVRVAGFMARTPMLEFVGRDSAACDLCGEKLTEPFVLQALGAQAPAFAVLAPETSAARGYVLLVDAGELAPADADAFAARVDAALGANPQYAYARRLGQLQPLGAVRLQAPLAAWIAHGLRRGRRLGDIKLPALYPHGDWRAVFSA